MNFEVREIGGKYKELIILSDDTKVKSRTLDCEECADLAKSLMQAALELLDN